MDRVLTFQMMNDEPDLSRPVKLVSSKNLKVVTIGITMTLDAAVQYAKQFQAEYIFIDKGVSIGCS